MKKRTKRIIQTVLIVIELILILELLKNNYPEYFFKQPKYIQIPPSVLEKEIKKPSLKIKKATKRYIVVIFTDENEEHLTFDRRFTLEKKINNDWIIMKDKDNYDCGSVGGAYLDTSDENNACNEIERTYSWGEQCSEMNSGIYRICTRYYQKYQNKKNICMEFEIE